MANVGCVRWLPSSDRQDAVVYAFSFCLLSKEELRVASSQILQGRFSRSSGVGLGGTPTPRQGTPLCLQHPACKQGKKAGCGWREAGVAPKGKCSARRALWAGGNTLHGAAACPGQQDPSGAGVLAAGLREQLEGAQRMLKDLERPTHQHLSEPCAHSLLPRHPKPSTGQAGRSRLAGVWQLTQQGFI